MLISTLILVLQHFHSDTLHSISYFFLFFFFNAKAGIGGCVKEGGGLVSASLQHRDVWESCKKLFVCTPVRGGEA